MSTATFDPTKPFGTVHGGDHIKYVQFGVHFNAKFEPVGQDPERPNTLEILRQRSKAKKVVEAAESESLQVEGEDSAVVIPSAIGGLATAKKENAEAAAAEEGSE